MNWSAVLYFVSFAAIAVAQEYNGFDDDQPGETPELVSHQFRSSSSLNF